MAKDQFLGALVLAIAVVLLFESEASDPSCLDPLDFETVSQDSCLRLASGSKGAVSRSTEKAKHGSRSLKWEGKANTILQYERTGGTIASGTDLRGGGIKVWLYKAKPSVTGKLKVSLKGKKTPNSRRTAVIAAFTVNLDFKGWRGIWVAYSECKTKKNILKKGSITLLEFLLPKEDIIYIDLLEFVKTMGRQSRDKIVPPCTKFGSMYDTSAFWQQTYRWSQKQPTPLPKTTDASKSRSLVHIESRLRNWYFNEDKTSYDLNNFQRQRWDSLTQSIKKAHKEYDRLDLDNGGPPLFCRNCVRGTRKYKRSDPARKFGFIMLNILLPLALEYHFRSRDKDIRETVLREASEIIADPGDKRKKQEALKKIAGDANDRKEFSKHLASLNKPHTEKQVTESIRIVNKVRLQRINKLLDYVEDQGWADGSAIGSLNHEMNRDGAGFMHTLFLVKDSLKKKTLLKLINTAKWYCDFGEVYQSPTFEFSGTTADRMITIMLFRLMIVLIMPTGTDVEIKERQRDMDALKTWTDNALTVNKGFGGVIKPDYTSFHHKAFYASSYTPHALHTAALVQYLLEGTNFALSDASKSNLRKALEVLRVTAVKYSTPSSVNGRFPFFSKAVLVKILPAYAYISATFPGPLLPTPPRGINIPGVQGAEMFLRLYKTTNDAVKGYLSDGKIRKGKHYMNSLGCLEIMSKIKDEAGWNAISAESSPEGHWSKNFAAFSIHRRKDWAVTVKGFNKFVWDFEGSAKENSYGMFSSHGAMLVANSEAALKAHDVSEGWDWSKLPGATTMSLKPDEMKLRKARNFSPRSMAGGVTFQGTEGLANGVFGMDFQQPDYKLSNPAKIIPQLTFKKSVFFYQNLIVCLGSDISLQGTIGQNKAQTTLFQDKLVSGSASSIKVNGVKKTYSNVFKAETPAIPRRKSYTKLIDTKDNTYYIPKSSASSLKVHVQDQKQPSGTARYATAWFEHSPSSTVYEYAVYVKTPSYKASDGYTLANVYEVVKQDGEAHVVSFRVNPMTMHIRDPVFGYVVFDNTVSFSKGPVLKVSKKCVLMAEETSHSLNLSISYTNLDFNVSPTNILKTSGDVHESELYRVESKGSQIVVLLRFDVMKDPKPTTKVHGSPTGYTPDVQVKSKSPSGTKGKRIVFNNLKNGFSVEVTLKKSKVTRMS